MSNPKTSSLDWTLLQSFLAVARHRSLSAAARSLHVTQSTMGRRLDALHEAAGVRLLQKTPEGYLLTKAGEDILTRVSSIEAEVIAVERSIIGADQRLAGEVRITTVEAFGAWVITPMLQPLLQQAPELQIEFITDYRDLSLARREADIAIRLAPFEQHEAFVQRVGSMAFGLFASRDYLCRKGELEAGDGTGHSLVTCQQDLASKPEATRLRAFAPNAFVCLRANSRLVQLQAVAAGCGIGLLPWYLGSGTDGLVELSMPGGRVCREVWLGVHRDTRDVPRIRLVVDQIRQGLRCLSDRLEPFRAPAPVQIGQTTMR